VGECWKYIYKVIFTVKGLKHLIARLPPKRDLGKLLGCNRWAQISFQTEGKALHPQHYKSKGVADSFSSFEKP